MSAIGVDLAELARVLAELPASAREGFVMGKTACKNALSNHLKCSEAEAERLVDTMVSRGILRFEEIPGRPKTWTVETSTA